MDAIRKIEAALAAIKGAQTLKALAAAQYDYHEACSTVAIREVLQTLASKEAELVRLRDALMHIEGATTDSYVRGCARSALTTTPQPTE